jgi:hypothetical protein
MPRQWVSGSERECGKCGKTGVRLTYVYPDPDARSEWQGVLACDECAPPLNERLVAMGVLIPVDQPLERRA